MPSDPPSAPWSTHDWLPSSGGRLDVMEPSRFLTVSPSATSWDFAPVAVVPTAAAIVETLRESPFENGEHHPLDGTFLAALRDDPAGFARAIGGAWATASARRPDLLLLLARLPANLAAAALLPLVASALASSRLGERDAAIRTLEAWGTEASRVLLMAHDEPNARLADYVGRVLDGMTRRSRG